MTERWVTGAVTGAGGDHVEDGSNARATWWSQGERVNATQPPQHPVRPRLHECRADLALNLPPPGRDLSKRQYSNRSPVEICHWVQFF